MFKALKLQFLGFNGMLTSRFPVATFVENLNPDLNLDLDPDPNPNPNPHPHPHPNQVATFVENVTELSNPSPNP